MLAQYLTKMKGYTIMSLFNKKDDKDDSNHAHRRLMKRLSQEWYNAYCRYNEKQKFDAMGTDRAKNHLIEKSHEIMNFEKGDLNEYMPKGLAKKVKEYDKMSAGDSPQDRNFSMRR